MATYTHQIISITAAKTKHGDRMWRCATNDGTSVYVFPENGKSLGSLRFFNDYIGLIKSLEDDEVLHWSEHPIQVELRKPGEYFEFVSVAPRPSGAVPDVPFKPKSTLSRRAASHWAKGILRSNAVIWDTETTGVDTKFDEIVSIAIVGVDGAILLDTMICPQNPQRLIESGATEINGITPDALISAPAFPEVYRTIGKILYGKTWVIYNAAFDTTILEHNALRHGLPPIPWVGINCAMEWYARYFEDWDAGRQSYKSKKLVDAAQALGVEIENSHRALDDSLATHEIIRRMAEEIIPAPSASAT